MTRLSYLEKSKLQKNETCKAFLELVEAKKTNLCISVDVNKKEEFLNIIDTVGPYVCLVKTHIDIIDDFDMDLVEKLLALAKKHNFMIFEDRKFADIGNTVKHQYSSGVYKIASWADFTNCHIVPGPGIIEGLREVGLSSDLPRQRALLLLAEMSSKGSLATDSYTDKNVELAKKYDDFAVGFIASRNLSADAPQLIVMTPGVGLDSTGDGLGQQYRTPEKIIGENASDIIIVGRGIIKAKDVAAEAQRYMKHGWDAYLNALKQ